MDRTHTAIYRMSVPKTDSVLKTESVVPGLLEFSKSLIAWRDAVALQSQEKKGGQQAGDAHGDGVRQGQYNHSTVAQTDNRRQGRGQ